MTRKQILVMVLIIPLAGLISGCVAAAIGAGAVGTAAFISGSMHAQEPANLEKVFNATVKAVDELGFMNVRVKKDVLTAVITARNVENKKIKIKLSVEDVDVTKISIRVGTFGNKAQSRQIYSQKKKNLQ